MDKPDRKRHFRLLIRLVGLLIFIWIVRRIDWLEVESVFGNINVPLFLVTLPMTFITIAIRTYRWRAIIARQGLQCSFLSCYRAYVASFAPGMITPGRVGELIKATYLTSQGCSYGRSLFTVVFDRIADLGVLMTLGITGAVIYASLFGTYFLFVVAILLIGAAAATTIYWQRAFLGGLLERILGSSGRGEKIRRGVTDFLAEFRNMSPRYCCWIAALSVLSWIFTFTQFYLFTVALGISITFWQVILFSCITSLAALIPITWFGIGTRDSALIILFQQINQTKETALSFSLCILLASLLYCLVSAIVWWFSPAGVAVSRNNAMPTPSAGKTDWPSP